MSHVLTRVVPALNPCGDGHAQLGRSLGVLEKTWAFSVWPGGSGLAVHLGPPPADADEQKPPVTEEFRRLAFEGVADELEDPSEDEKREGVGPQAMRED